MEREGVRLLLLLFVASVPTAAIGLTFEDLFEQLFSTPAVLTITFAMTGVLLFLTRGRDQGTLTLASMPVWMAFALGVAQGLAITPGISRSGTTIAVALILGVNREFAARFSFLMSLPAILGAVIFKLKDVEDAALDPVQLGVGGLTALVSGYVALHLLVKVVKQGQFSWFAPYCWCVAVAAGVIAWQVG
jgi:undecaprenyl-diphosphatase